MNTLININNLNENNPCETYTEEIKSVKAPNPYRIFFIKNVSSGLYITSPIIEGQVVTQEEKREDFKGQKWMLKPIVNEDPSTFYYLMDMDTGLYMSVFPINDKEGAFIKISSYKGQYSSWKINAYMDNTLNIYFVNKLSYLVMENKEDSLKEGNSQIQSNYKGLESQFYRLESIS